MARFSRSLAMVAVALTVVVAATDFAEARRAGGGFGSRGTRTFSAPPVTRTAPAPAAPVERTMTPQTTRPGVNQAQPGAAQTAQARRPGGFFSGFGGSLLGGLALGGLIGMMMGHGFGGMAGMLGFLLQLLLIAGLVMLAMRFFARNRNQPSAAGAAPYGAARQANGGSGGYDGSPRAGGAGFTIPKIGGHGTPAQASVSPKRPGVTDEIGIGPADLDRFEAMLKDVQTAYGAEDYAALRRLTTPEAMSWLAEELSENATNGLRNEVRDVRLLQGDLAEAWREEAGDYATVAMRYESIDVTRDRATGAVRDGDPDRLTEATELWTFFRRPNTQWQVSAIQGVQA